MINKCTRMLHYTLHGSHMYFIEIKNLIFFIIINIRSASQSLELLSASSLMKLVTTSFSTLFKSSCFLYFLQHIVGLIYSIFFYVFFLFWFAFSDIFFSVLFSVLFCFFACLLQKHSDIDFLV